MDMTPMTISELEAKGKGPVYVINNTGNNDRIKTPGVLIIAIPRPTGNGNPITVTVPQTWLPVDLTLQVPYGHLIESAEFRNAVLQEFIHIARDEHAEFLLSREGAQQERERLAEEARKANHAGPSRFMTSPDSQVVDLTSDEATGISIEEDGFTPAFIAKVNRWQTMEDIAVLNEMRSGGKFTIKQLKYIKEHLPTQKTTKACITATLKKNKA